VKPRSSIQTGPRAGTFDLAIVGGGASGLVAAIAAARRGKRVVVCEKSASPGLKLLSTGGQRCNLSNTLSREEFMERVGRDGRFMGPALEVLGGQKLREFFAELGIATVVHDGFRVWPETRESATVLAGLLGEQERLGVEFALGCRVVSLEHDGEYFAVVHERGDFRAHEVILATGGLALPGSGACGDGYELARRFGHHVTPRYPAGVPLLTAEKWPARCTAHTIGKARLQVALKSHSRIVRTGDLIFTSKGIAGPVVLDISREISPLLERFETVPLWLDLGRGRNQEEWLEIFKTWRQGGTATVQVHLAEHFPHELAEVFCELVGIEEPLAIRHLGGARREELIRILVKTPLTVVATGGYDAAFVTRGGVSLKEVRPETLESKLQPGLYLCGEVFDLDGPCGGFNLQWAFASGYLAGGGRRQGQSRAP